MKNIESIGYIYDKTSIKKMSYDFNIKQFFNTDAIGVIILTPYEVFLASGIVDENLHHSNISNQIVKIIGKSRFENSLFSQLYSLPVYHEIRFNTYFGTITDFDKNHKLYGTVITEKMKQTAIKLKEIVTMIRNNKENEEDLGLDNDINTLIEACDLKVVDDNSVIREDEKKVCYGVPLEMFYNSLILLLEELKGNKQWQYTQ